MSSLETAAAVAAVMSAFFTGSEMAKQIMKRNRKPKGEKAIKEKMLQESLLAGEHQIGQMFTNGYEQTGRRFRVGDGKCYSDVAPTMTLLMLHRSGDRAPARYPCDYTDGHHTESADSPEA